MPRGRIILYRSIARAVWRHDRKLGTILLQAHVAARSLLQVDADAGVLSLRDFERFTRDLDQLQTGDLEAQRTKISNSINDDAPEKLRRKRRQQMRRLQKRASIWAPFDRRLTLQGTRPPSNDIATQPEEMAREICVYWGTVS
eukprot:6711608-Pyramimonas_sp.AAC.1